MQREAVRSRKANAFSCTKPIFSIDTFTTFPPIEEILGDWYKHFETESTNTEQNMEHVDWYKYFETESTNTEQKMEHVDWYKYFETESTNTEQDMEHVDWYKYFETESTNTEQDMEHVDWYKYFETESTNTEQDMEQVDWYKYFETESTNTDKDMEHTLHFDGFHWYQTQLFLPGPLHCSVAGQARWLEGTLLTAVAARFLLSLTHALMQ